MRKATDDTSTIKPMQPASTEIALNMHGRRDYRGLKTIVDMSGTVVAHHSLTNSLNEAIFVLLKCPHPRAESDSTSGLLAGGLKLQASVPGIQENSKESWLWSGTIEGHGSVGIQTSYQVMSLKGFTYKIGSQEGEPVKQARLTFHRRDLDSIQFESGDGRIQPTNDTVVWERSDFLGSDSFPATFSTKDSPYDFQGQPGPFQSELRRKHQEAKELGHACFLQNFRREPGRQSAGNLSRLVEPRASIDLR